jgi:TonB family protein
MSKSFWPGVIFLIGLTTLSSKPEGLQTTRAASAQNSQSPDMTRAAELNGQVKKLFDDQKYKEALTLAVQEVDLLDRALPTDDARICVALNNLGSIYSALKKYDEAGTVFVRALSVCDASGKDPVTTGSVLEGLGSVRSFKHDYEKSAPLLLRAIKLREQTLGPLHPKTVAAMKLYACVDLYARERNHALKLDPSADPDYAVRARSMCWLAGLMNDCADVNKVKAEDLVNEKALRLITPRYPPEARTARVNGSIFVAVLIDEYGNVVQAKPVCGGHTEFIRASIEAAMQSKFTPTTVSNKPVKMTGTISYHFYAQ